MISPLLKSDTNISFLFRGFKRFKGYRMKEKHVKNINSNSNISCHVLIFNYYSSGSLVFVSVFICIGKAENKIQGGKNVS